MKQDIEEVRRAFFIQVQNEYDDFRRIQVRGGIEKVYDNSLKITFYKEVHKYLMDDVLHDEEYSTLQEVSKKIFAKISIFIL